MFRFPFTNFHELNLDWILSVVKQAKEVFDNGSADIAHAIETSEQALTVAEQAASATIADGSVTAAKLANESVTTNKLYPAAVTGEKVGLYTIREDNLKRGVTVKKNMLDNWCFMAPYLINQRGQTIYEGGTSESSTPVFDRWKLAGRVQILDDGIKLNGTLYQYVPEIIMEHTVVSYLTNNGIRYGFYNPTSHMCSITSNAEETIYAAKLEKGYGSTIAFAGVGDVLSLSEYPSISDTLFKCQHYLQVLRGDFFDASIIGTGIMFFSVPLVRDLYKTTGLELIQLDGASMSVVSLSGASQSDFTFEITSSYGAIAHITARKANHGLSQGCLVVRGGNYLISAEP